VQLLEHIQKEWAVLKGAPLSFVILVVLGLLTGIAIGSWHYSGRLEEKDSQLSRYRVALGIDKASAGALIELNNEELRAKALATAARLHEMCISFRERGENLQKELAASKLSEKEKGERTSALIKQESDEFDQTTRTDAAIVEIELRRRLSPEAKASIVGLPPAFRGSNGGFLPLMNILSGSGMDATFICVDADGIEAMAKLLPPDSK
jgi:hypothetical protein